MAWEIKSEDHKLNNKGNDGEATPRNANKISFVKKSRLLNLTWGLPILFAGKE